MNDELNHHGILGQKWGVRRYQNYDGTLTPAGKKRYQYNESTGMISEKGHNRLTEDHLKTIMRDKDYRKNAKTQYKRLRKGFDTDLRENGYIDSMRDLKGKDVSYKDFIAYLNYDQYKSIKRNKATVRKLKAGTAAMGVALAAIGGVSIAKLMGK